MSCKYNSTVDVLFSRKSIRAYEDRPIAKEDKETILKAALSAPTAGNMTLYTILDITDQKKKDRLAVTCDNQPFIAKAPMVLIFCADYRRWYEVFKKYNDDIRKPAEGDLLLAEADAIIAAQNAVIAAQSLGVGSCYIGDITENYEIHKDLLKLPDYVVPACMVCFGYPTQQQLEREKIVHFSVSDIVHENEYQSEKSSWDAMEKMLIKRKESLNKDSIGDWLRRFCDFKWNSHFSKEMSRSCKEMIKDWTK